MRRHTCGARTVCESRSAWTARRPPTVRAAVFCLIAAGCSDASSPYTSPEDVVATITLSTAGASLRVRQTVPLSPAFRDAAGRRLTGLQQVRLMSSDPSVVGVEEGGLVTAHRVGGPVTVRVEADSVVATATFTVVPVLGIVSGPSALGVDSSATASAAYVDFFNAPISPAVVTWSSSSAHVARVDATTGLIEGLQPGLTSIVATTGSVQATLALEVGVASASDGHWVAPLVGRFEGTFRVLFGTVRSIDLSVLAIGTPLNGPRCAAALSSTAHAPIADGRFETMLPFQALVSGEFTGDGALRATISGAMVPAAAYDCPPGIAPQVGGTIATTTIVAARVE